MEGGRGARRPAPPSSGCSWAAFEETAKDYGTSGAGVMPWARVGGRYNVPAREIEGGEGEGDTQSVIRACIRTLHCLVSFVL